MAELSISEYQAGTKNTAIYGESTRNANIEDLRSWANLSYVANGLAGEAGEFAGEVKKAIRDDTGIISRQRQEQLFRELGDVAWYLSQACNELGFKLEEVLDYNLVKLASRQERGVLTGSGDER